MLPGAVLLDRETGRPLDDLPEFRSVARLLADPAAYVRSRVAGSVRRESTLRLLDLAAARPEIVAAFDPVTNFPYSTVQVGSTIIGSAGSPKSIKLATGDGASFPGGDGTTTFNVVLWPSASRPLGTNAEISRVTRVGDTLTTTARAQEGTVALATIAAGYQVMAAITAKTLTDIELGDPVDVLTTVEFAALVPTDRQQVILEVDATNGIYWRLRYRAGSASAYKFEMLGGTCLLAIITTAESLPADATATYRALGTAGPSISLPFGGDYDVEIAAEINAATQTATGNQQETHMSYDIGGTGAVDGDSLTAWQATPTGVNSAWGSYLRRVERKTGLTAVTLTSKYRHNANGTGTGGTFTNRQMSVLPIRIGQV